MTPLSSPAIGIASVLTIDYIRRQSTFESDLIIWAEWLSCAILALVYQILERQNRANESVPSDAEAQIRRSNKKTATLAELLFALAIVAAQLTSDVVKDAIAWALVRSKYICCG